MKKECRHGVTSVMPGLVSNGLSHVFSRVEILLETHSSQVAKMIIEKSDARQEFDTQLKTRLDAMEGMVRKLQAELKDSREHVGLAAAAFRCVERKEDVLGSARVRGRRGEGIACKFWARGRCRLGDGCKFWHEEISCNNEGMTDMGMAMAARGAVLVPAGALASPVAFAAVLPVAHTASSMASVFRMPSLGAAALATASRGGLLAAGFMMRWFVAPEILDQITENYIYDLEKAR